MAMYSKKYVPTSTTTTTTTKFRTAKVLCTSIKPPQYQVSILTLKIKHVIKSPFAYYRERYMHGHTQEYAGVRAHTHTHTHTHARARARARERTHARTRVHTHTQMHIIYLSIYIGRKVSSHLHSHPTIDPLSCAHHAARFDIWHEMLVMSVHAYVHQLHVCIYTVILSLPPPPRG